MGNRRECFSSKGLLICCVLSLWSAVATAQQNRGICFDQLPTDVNCDTRSGELRYYFNAESVHCELFRYRGIYENCAQTRNVFETRTSCETTCEFRNCFYPPVTGTCEGDQSGQTAVHYYYNAASQTCVQFSYSGCVGNSNNFITPEACQATCQPECSARIHRGSSECDEGALRWAFDPDKAECIQFKWSGCDGHSNNFATDRECMLKCGHVTPCVLRRCELVCPWGYKRDSNGCSYCACFDPCLDVSCLLGESGQPQQKIQFLFNCDTFSCQRLDFSTCRCYDECFGGAEFDTCTKVPRDCDATCEDTERSCIPVGGCIPRCRCPTSKPFLHDGVCLSAEECPSFQGGIAAALVDPVAFSCYFDSLAQLSMCGMRQALNDGGDWQIVTGASPNRPHTGPKSDYTGSGGYLLLDSRLLMPGFTMKLTTPKFTPSSCIRFFYYMFGRNVGTLKVIDETGPDAFILWSKTRTTETGLDEWQEAVLDLSTPVDQVSFHGTTGGALDITGTLGQAFAGDIAIDNILISTLKCSVSAIQPTIRKGYRPFYSSDSNLNVVSLEVIVVVAVFSRVLY